MLATLTLYYNRKVQSSNSFRDVCKIVITHVILINKKLPFLNFFLRVMLFPTKKNIMNSSQIVLDLPLEWL